MKINTKNFSRGFTFLELMVSLIIIGILVTIVSISVVRSRERASNARIKTDIDQLNQSLVSYMALTSKSAPITERGTTSLPKNGYTKKVDDPSSGAIESGYGITLKEIFSKYSAIPVRPQANEQNCFDTATVATNSIGYCYVRYPSTIISSTPWAIYAGLLIAEETNKVFYGSVNGTLKPLILNTDSQFGIVPKID